MLKLSDSMLESATISIEKLKLTDCNVFNINITDGNFNIFRIKMIMDEYKKDQLILNGNMVEINNEIYDELKNEYFLNLVYTTLSFVSVK